MAERRFESRMLIDGRLVGGEAGGFTNANPATEAVQYTELKSVAYPAV